MSYATLLDALFALDLADYSTLEEESIPGAHPEEPADEPKLPEAPAMTGIG